MADDDDEGELSSRLNHLSLSWGKKNVRRSSGNNGKSSPRKNLVTVPLNALGVQKNEKYTYKDTMKDQRRMRKQVGQTNRWRLPEPLGSDLLGTSQALRAIETPLNTTMQRIISAESPQTSVNMDPNKPYSFRRMSERQILTRSAPSSTEANRSKKPPKRSSSTQNIFYHFTKKAKATLPADQTWTNYDILLKCLNIHWELHSQFICKSPVLAKLIEASPNLQTDQNRRLYNFPSTSLKRSASRTDSQRSGHQHNGHPKEERVVSARADQYPASETCLWRSSPTDENVSLCHSSPSMTGSTSMDYYSEKPTCIKLDINDSMVNKKGLAIAFGNLYYEELNVDPLDIPPTLAAAHILEYENLKERCAEAMCDAIATETIVLFHKTAIQYNLEEISIFCERWLELNLIPRLACEIQLGDLPQSLVEKTISSRNLFTEDEFAVYLCLCNWLFLRLNPHCYSVPSTSAIIAYFNCLCKDLSFLETDEGALYIPLFLSIRFQGITDTNHIHMMKVMNIIPQNWLVDVLCQHYSALQCGGDMTSINNFEFGSIRQGIVVEKGKSYDSEVMSLHGFHFNLRISCLDNVYTFYIQRLKPADPTLSFRACERHTFSLRSERTVNYCITVQTYSHGKLTIRSTGIIDGTFRHGKKTSKSKELIVKGETFPLYATFAVLLPRS